MLAPPPSPCPSRGGFQFTFKLVAYGVLSSRRESNWEEREKDSPSPLHTGNSQILKRPRERVAELSCRVQCTGAGAFLPDTREERAGPSREKGRQRERKREREWTKERENSPRCFSCSPIRYINIPNRDSRRYIRRNARARGRESFFSFGRFRAARGFGSSTERRLRVSLLTRSSCRRLLGHKFAERLIDHWKEHLRALENKNERKNVFFNIFYMFMCKYFLNFVFYLGAYNFISEFNCMKYFFRVSLTCSSN